MSVLDLPIASETIEEFLSSETTSPEVSRRIHELKAKLRDKVVILGHHYQRDDIIQFADKTGDSFELARYAASLSDREFIIFCGVHFMAETADVLSGKHQTVILPDLKAGCSMSDMARSEQVFDAWDALSEVTDTNKICPITYMNSSAAIKAFCGEHGGAVSTSSNNKAIFEWAFKQGFKKIFFFPDQHLGRNTAFFRMGIPLDEIVLFDQTKGGLGGLTKEQIAKAKIILWRGHCSVHQHFQPSHPDIMRALYPGIKILVHPECMFDVVQKADLVGSTSFICKTVESAEPGSSFAIGTEHHLVNRLKKENPDKFITTLAPYACECATMYRISPEALLDILEGIDKGKTKNEIHVGEQDAHWARVALQRMLDITI
ncbi:MAG TPA: quinolinate synthase NadA [Candidatus Kapabacteria bacterium]|nr:quinolinate synthase NadA [Candidatus Kapabacteria bacterium]